MRTKPILVLVPIMISGCIAAQAPVSLDIQPRILQSLDDSKTLRVNVTNSSEPENGVVTMSVVGDGLSQLPYLTDKIGLEFQEEPNTALVDLLRREYHLLDVNQGKVELKPSTLYVGRPDLSSVTLEELEKKAKERRIVGEYLFSSPNAAKCYILYALLTADKDQLRLRNLYLNGANHLF